MITAPKRHHELSLLHALARFVLKQQCDTVISSVADEEAEAPKGEVLRPKPHSFEVAVPGLERCAQNCALGKNQDQGGWRTYEEAWGCTVRL